MNSVLFSRGFASIDGWVRKATWLAFSLLLAAAAAAMLYYSFGPFRPIFNSDDAASVLYAREMLDQGTLLPQWNNATGVMIPLIMPRLMVEPLVLLVVDDWFIADRIAIALDQALMFALIWWLLGRGGLSRIARMFLIAVLLIGPSWMFWNQSTLLAGKSWSYAFTLLIAWLGWRMAEHGPAGGIRRGITTLLLCASLIFIDSANAATLLPGLCVAFGLEAMSKEPRRSASAASVIATLLAAAVAGRLLFGLLLRNSTYSPMSIPFVSPDDVGRNLHALLLGLPVVFGAIPAAGTTPYSLTAAAAGIKFVLLIVALGAPFYFFLYRDRLANSYARLLAVACATSLTLRIYIFLFTGISLGNPIGARYFITDLILGLTVVAFYLQQRAGSRRFYEPLVLAAVLPFAATPAFRDPSAVGPKTPASLARELLATGVTQGYAGFWNANTITVQTNGAFRMRQVKFEHGTAEPYYWLASNHWFDGDAGAKRSLLLLDGTERKIPLPNLDRIAGPPERIIELSGGYEARIYPFDLALRMGWKRSMNAPLSAADTRSRVETAAPPSVDPDTGDLVLRWRVENLGDLPLVSYGRYPVYLGLHALSADGRMLDFDLLRTILPVLEPHAVIEVETRVAPRRLAGATRIEADLVQEGIAWFATRGNATAHVELPPTPLADAGKTNLTSPGTSRNDALQPATSR
jgi:hypothetical protein